MNREESVIRVSSGLLAAFSTNAIKLHAFSKDVLVLECIVAGTSFRDLSKVHEKLDGEIEIEIKREPDNRFDAFAVALHFNGNKIGYLPKLKNETIARLLDAGKDFFAVLTTKEWEGNWLKLEVKVFLKD